MRTFIKNLGRFRAATWLNLFGLTVAYVTALVIGLQVTAEYQVDTKYPDGDRIYRLEYSNPELWRTSAWQTTLSRPMADLLEGLSPQIEEIAYNSENWMNIYFKIEGRGAEEGSFCPVLGNVSPSFVNQFGMQIVEGTSLGSDPNQVIIPLSMARERFAGQSPVGQTIEYVSSKTRITIAGVYRDFPSWSTFKNAVYKPIGDENRDQWQNYNYAVYLKLRPGADTAQVTAVITEALRQALVDVGRKVAATAIYRMTPISETFLALGYSQYHSQPTGNRIKLQLFALAAFLVVVIGAINYANFAIALIPMRIRGINTRKVYGATNAQLRRGLLFEAIGLSVGAYLLATLAVCAVDSLDAVSFVHSKVVPTDHFDVLGYGVVLAVVVGLVAGLFPAFYSTSIPAAVALKGSFGLSPRGKLLRTVLVGFQFAVSVVLIIATLVMNLQYRYLQSRDMGFDRHYVLNGSITPGLADSFSTLTAQLGQLPEVTDVTYGSSTIVGAYSGYGRDFRGEIVFYDATQVASNFVSFYGLKVFEGSDFSPASDLKPIESEALFNRTAKNKYGLAVGDSISGGRIVGFVEDFHTASFHSFIGPFALLNFGNVSEGYYLPELHLRVRTHDLSGLTKKIQAVCRQIDPNYMGSIQLLDSYIEELYAEDQRATTMITWFGAAAILVSLFGVFGLVRFEVTARRKEIGLRRINGASVKAVLAIFAGRFVWLVVGACVVGLPVAWWVVQALLESFAYRVPIGFWVYAVSAVLVFVVVMATVILQTLSAARENPINYMREE